MRYPSGVLDATDPIDEAGGYPPRAATLRLMTVRRQRGSHVMLVKPGLPRAVVLPIHNREISGGTIRSLLSQAQISQEEFLKHV